MSYHRTNLPGTFEFFDLSEAQTAADKGMLRSGTVIVVNEKAYKAIYCDEEKRTVIAGGPTYTLQDALDINPKRKK